MNACANWVPSIRPLPPLAGYLGRHSLATGRVSPLDPKDLRKWLEILISGYSISHWQKLKALLLMIQLSFSTSTWTVWKRESTPSLEWNLVSFEVIGELQRHCVSHVLQCFSWNAQMGAQFLQAKSWVPLSFLRHCPHRAWSVTGIFYTGEVGIPCGG